MYRCGILRGQRDFPIQKVAGRVQKFIYDFAQSNIYDVLRIRIGSVRGGKTWAGDD